ncbi:ArsA family ATPase [Luteimonas aestuarii]|uniref:arsenite-transporting ATPase n=1 Tax=Luteimonas aestuarii TaxID=453837 RepID=A0A4R5U1L4_9GAMM|nr:ArsA family ATPase [Luteimonas aestuarii]TDK27495.1 ArsA family ATPase [Luteimonas aestuarii]
MLLTLASSRRVLFFGGKGGVGKTTVAAATALAQADAGGRVLLVSTDPAHNLGHLWGRTIGPQAQRVAPGLDAVEIDPDATVEAHLAQVGDALRRLMPEHLSGEVDKHLALSRDAPGMHEAALLERIAETVERGLRDYDLLVFDTAPSGHTARLMALPEMMSAWTEGLLQRQQRAERFGDLVRNLGSDEGIGGRALGGERADTPADRDQRIRELLHRRRHRFAHLRETIVDATTTAFVIVLAAERLPVLETIELHAQLQRAGVAVGGLLVNKRSPADAGTFLAARRRQEAAHLETLRMALPGLAMEQLPLQPDDVLGAAALRGIARQLLPAETS